MGGSATQPGAQQGIAKLAHTGGRNAAHHHPSRRRRAGVSRQRGARIEIALDSWLYALSAIVAFAVAFTGAAPLDRQWAAVAVVAYAVGALVARVQLSRGASIRGRALLVAALFAAVAVVPLLIHSAERIAGGPRVHVKSDVLVVEQAATHLLAGRDPYAVSFDKGPIASWPEATRTHFPYLPAILLFGLPKVVARLTPWTDPRLICLAATAAITIPSLALAPVESKDRLRAFQVLLVLVSGAPLVFTSGKELPVLALLLASLVALDRGHFLISGTAAGLAVSAHQLAWVVLPLLALAPRARKGRSGGQVTFVAAASVAIVFIAPLVVWDAKAFIDDAIRYPLGLGQPVGSGQITPGGLVGRLFDDARWLPLVVLCVAITAVIVVLARRAPNPNASEVALGAGSLLLVALLLAPRVRIAYFAFPLNLLLWALLLRRTPAPEPPTPESRRPTTARSSSVLP